MWIHDTNILHISVVDHHDKLEHPNAYPAIYSRKGQVTQISLTGKENEKCSQARKKVVCPQRTTTQ